MVAAIISSHCAIRMLDYVTRRYEKLGFKKKDLDIQQGKYTCWAGEHVINYIYNVVFFKNKITAY